MGEEARARARGRTRSNDEVKISVATINSRGLIFVALGFAADTIVLCIKARYVVDDHTRSPGTARVRARARACTSTRRGLSKCVRLFVCFNFWRQRAATNNFAENVIGLLKSAFPRLRFLPPREFDDVSRLVA